MQSPFDILAETYDTDFSETAVGKLQRKQVWELLAQVLNEFGKRIRILEINCGTGDDALHLGRLGHSIIATDASEVMIKKANCKAAVAMDDVQFLVCPFKDLHSNFKGEKFDLVISNFGGLNCIDEDALGKLGRELSTVLKPNGKLFIVVMSKSCLWEIVYFSVKGKVKTAFRRQKQSVEFKAGSVSMPVFYYSPGILKRTLMQHYTYIQSRPIGLLLPPSYLEKSFLKRQYLLRRLEDFERKLNRYDCLSNLADHFCIIFQKKNS